MLAMSRLWLSFTYESLKRAIALTGDPRRLALVFCAQTTIAVFLLAMLVPPFENSDEFNHYDRVDQIASGGLLATRYGGPHTSGGVIDLGINQIDDIIGTVRFHPERKVTGTMLRQAATIKWGHHGLMTFSNTAIYAPFLYLPAVLGVWIGKLSGLSIMQTLIVSRTLTGLTSMVTAGIAIALAGEAAMLLFVLLSLPMVLSLFASVSQDGPMIAAAALAIVLAGRKSFSRAALTGICVCLVVLGIGRPAYLPFVALLLMLRGIDWRRRIIAGSTVLLAILTWSGLVGVMTMINASPSADVNAPMQLSALLHHPDRIFSLAWSSVTSVQGMEGRSFYVEFVGMLGWIDVALPGWFYFLTGAILLMAMLTAVARPTPMLTPLRQGVLFLATLTAVASVSCSNI